jgi:hypothetical protein
MRYVKVSAGPYFVECARYVCIDTDVNMPRICSEKYHVQTHTHGMYV